MNRPVDNVDKTRRFRLPKQPYPGSREIDDLDDIPDFDSPEEEMRFWKTNHLSKNILDQVQHSFEDDE